MDVEIIEEQTGAIEILSFVPDDLRSIILTHARPVVMQGVAFRALFQELEGNGFTVWYSNYWMQRPVVLKARADQPVLELRIAMKNQINGTWEKILVPALKEYFFSLSFTPHVLTRAIFEENKEYQTFDIHFSFDFLISIGIDYKTLDTFLKKVQHRQPAELSPFPHPCPGEMVDAVDAVLHNSYSAKAQPYLLECKVKEILISALETLGRSELTLPIAIRPYDIEKLYEAKTFIDESLPEWPTPEMICKHTGLNELKLKIGFRYLFNITPYEYYRRLKLKEAKRLLLEGKESITSVAYMTGYDHLSSFSREFKKEFGYTPGYFKLNGHY